MFHLYAVFLALSCWFLILAGGLVTSTESSLSVPDWPLSYGQVFPSMVGGIFYEHGHRMIAATIGFLTLLLCVFAWKTKQRKVIKILASVAVGAVILQGTLGGLTVLFLLPKPISIAHACLGQIFFSTLVTTAFLSSPRALQIKNQGQPLAPRRWAVLTIVLTGGMFLQLILAALVRHFKAGLAIPTFPLAFGKWLPESWNWNIFIHFVHRNYGILLMLAWVWVVTKLLRNQELKPLRRLFQVLLVLFPLQVCLGILTIWTGKDPSLTSAHVAVGAAALVLCLQVAIFLSLNQGEQVRVYFRDVWELGKPRISLFVALTAFVGAYFASPATLDLPKILYACIATYLVSYGACAFNQIIEVNVDKTMKRTMHRPLSSGRMSLLTSWILALAATLLGVTIFLWKTNLLAAFISLVTLLTYILIYTPLKKISSLNTFAGAVPGALPPVIGWTAVTGHMQEEALFLFVLIFLWQLPHFLAIAFMYQKDYEQAGMPMLPVAEKGVELTSQQMIMSSLALVPVVTFPVMMGKAGIIYLISSIVLGMIFTWMSFEFRKNPNRSTARQVLLGSVLYLPSVLILLTLDKL